MKTPYNHSLTSYGQVLLLQRYIPSRLTTPPLTEHTSWREGRESKLHSTWVCHLWSRACHMISVCSYSNTTRDPSRGKHTAVQPRHETSRLQAHPRIPL